MITLATIDSYASQVAGVAVTISCEADATFDPRYDGFTLAGADGTILRVLHIRQSECTNAESVDRTRAPHPVAYVAFQGQRVDEQSGPALETILHEAMHVSLQSRDEGLVECTAYLNRWSFVRLFRLPAKVASMVMAGMAWNHFAVTAQFPTYGTVC